VPKNRPRALKTALGEVHNVFKNNKNVAISAVIFLKVQTIIVIIVLILFLASLSKMI
jgi:hypothetical protein